MFCRIQAVILATAISRKIPAFGVDRGGYRHSESPLTRTTNERYGRDSLQLRFATVHPVAGIYRKNLLVLPHSVTGEAKVYYGIVQSE